ncbi:MAG: HXXEE domain-containing protein [Pseudomonadota bacterium]
MMWERLSENWVYGGVLAAPLFVMLAPFVAVSAGQPTMFIFLALPAYMIHQYEEHDGDRFRIFVNSMVGGEALTKGDVFWINYLGVWILLMAALWLHLSVAPGAGLIAPYLLLVNGLVHIAQAVKMRRYNPGLWTAVLWFLPLAAVTFREVEAPLLAHLASLGVVIALHGLIVYNAMRRLAAQK